MPLPPAPATKAARLPTGAYTIQTLTEGRQPAVSAGGSVGTPSRGDATDPKPRTTRAKPVAVTPTAQQPGMPSDRPATASSSVATPARRATRKSPAAPVDATASRIQGLPTQPATTTGGTAVVAGSEPAIDTTATLPPATLPEVLPPSSSSASSSRKSSKRKPARQGPAKLFVLDTNVLLHDPTSLFRFEEHDVYLPMIVLEELDGHKKGMTEVARNGRQTSRTLDALAAQAGDDMLQGLPLSGTGHVEAKGRLFFQTEPLHYALPTSLPQGKADNQILGVVQALQERHPGRVVAMVSKDINMRVKARALGLDAQDYESDKTLDDGELLYSGALALGSDFWTRQSKGVESWQQGSHTFYRISSPVVAQFHINQFVYFESPGEPSLYARVVEIREKTAVLKTLRDFTHLKNGVWGVTSRNREQNFALNLLMDPDIDFVTLAGTAGTGKTLMALVAGLTQVLDDRRYTEIIMTRATVSVGEDIGFLPGTEEEKMGPWMGALDDNLEFLAKGDGGNAGEWGRAATSELIRSRIKIKSMNFMRGRTFMNKYVIIDEAQNLTPKQMKTLITRAGPGTKIICMGNLAQIDTPYLTEGSSGMTYAVDRFKGWPHGGHITLARGERSRLADFASDVL
ncbi:MAG: PhoH family protein [Burkholderiaceae bacterium]|nr:PhoH family protein [Burkholderiaceae bacterium]